MLTDISLIDKFMAALSSKESGGISDIPNPDSGAYGTFQIMPENWGEWSQEAGLGSSALMTAENQYIVARYKLLQYFGMYGNWRDVAIAWYHGNNAADWTEEMKNRRFNAEGYFDPNGKYPSLNEYANDVIERFQSGIGAETYGGISGQNPIEESLWEKFKKLPFLLSPQVSVPEYQKQVKETKDVMQTGINSIFEKLTGIVKIFVGLVLMIFGIYLFSKTDSIKLVKEESE